MIDLKPIIFAKLSEISGIKIYQIRPEVLSIDLFPIVTFFLSRNDPMMNLAKQVDKQNTDITVDIWAKTSKQTSAIMLNVISKMLELNYLCTHNIDIPDPEGFSHLNLIFTY